MRNKLFLHGSLVLATAAGLGLFALTRSATTAQAPRTGATMAMLALPHGGVASHTEQVETTFAVDPDTLAVIGTSLDGHRARAGAAEAAIADARAGRIDAIALGLRLHDAVLNHPELGHGLLLEMIAEKSPQLTMQMAHALAGLEDDATLRQQTVDALRAAPSSARAVGMMALLGRTEPECVDLEAESFARDPDDARATAAFLLNNSGGMGPFADQAVATARDALANPDADARVREEATTMLGRQDATPADVATLERLTSDASPAVQARALAALEASNADRSQVLAAFNRVANDPTAAEIVQQMAKAYLARG
jgi:hypothetical protein